MAVTGTNGKTSTKEMLAAVLGTRYRTHATRANLNNLVGVPTHHPGSAGRHRGAGGRGRRQPAGRDRPLPRDHRAVADDRDQRGRRPPRGIRLAGRGHRGEARRSPTACRWPSWAPSRRSWQRGRDGGRARCGRPDCATPTSSPIASSSVRTRDPCSRSARRTFTLAARGLHQADNATRVWAVVEAARPRPRRGGRGARALRDSGGAGRAAGAGRAHHPQRLLQRQPPELPRGHRDGAGAPRRPAAGLHRGHDAGAGRGVAGAAPRDRGRAGRARSRTCWRRSATSSRRSRRTPSVWATGWSRRRIRSRSARWWRRVSRAAKWWCSRHPAGWPSNVYFPRSPLERGSKSPGAMSSALEAALRCRAGGPSRRPTDPPIGGPQPVEAVEQLLHAQLSLAGPADALDDAATMHDQDPLA